MRFRELPGSLRLRLGVGFVERLLDSMITSFMAIYLASTYSVALAGVLMLVVVSCGAGGMLLGGQLAGSRGRRPTLLVAESAAFLAFAVMTLGTPAAFGSPLLVYLAYLGNRFAASIGLPANDSMIVDLTTPETRKNVYTVKFWATNLALAIGAMTGAVLYDGGFGGMLVAAAIATGCMLLTTVRWIPETRPATAASEAAPARTGGFAARYRAVLADRRFMRLMLARTLILGIEFQLINYIGVRLAAHFPEQTLFSVGDWGLHLDGTEMLGTLRAENTILVVVVGLATPIVFRKLTEKFALSFGTILFTAGYMVLAVSNSGWLLMVAGFVFTIGELMNAPVRQTLLANLVPERGRGQYMAMSTLNIRVAQMIAALCISLGAFVPPWAIATLYGVGGLVIVVQYHAIFRKKSTRDEAVAPDHAAPATTRRT